MTTLDEYRSQLAHRKGERPYYDAGMLPDAEHAYGNYSAPWPNLGRSVIVRA